MIHKFQGPDGDIEEATTRQRAEQLIAAGYWRVPASTTAESSGGAVDPVTEFVPMTPGDGHDPNAEQASVDQLLLMTVNAQSTHLSRLSDEELAELADQETRKTALDNIEDEIETRTKPDGSN